MGHQLPSFDVLVVWALDRLGRSMTGNLQAVLALDASGVLVVGRRQGTPLRPPGEARGGAS